MSKYRHSFTSQIISLSTANYCRQPKRCMFIKLLPFSRLLSLPLFPPELLPFSWLLSLPFFLVSLAFFLFYFSSFYFLSSHTLFFFQQNTNSFFFILTVTPSLLYIKRLYGEKRH